MLELQHGTTTTGLWNDHYLLVDVVALDVDESLDLLEVMSGNEVYSAVGTMHQLAWN